MKNKLLVLSFFITSFLLTSFVISAQESTEFIQAGKDVVRIEINTANVDVYIATHDKEFIAYKIEKTGDKEIYSFESKKKLQFYTTAVTKGKIFIYIPENFLLESCRIQSIHSIISVQNIKSIYFVVSGTFTNVKVAGSKFKNVLLATTNSNIQFTSGIVAVADFCFSLTKGKIEIAEEMKDCNLFMTQIQNKYLSFNGEPCEKRSLSYMPEKPKKYISISASMSNLDIKFIPPLKNPTESFNKYGISEFGPKPPPQLVDPVSRFLPKPNK